MSVKAEIAAYNDGYDAASAGLPNINPYSGGEVELSRAWSEGFHQAELDRNSKEYDYLSRLRVLE